jgi:hypothetical protein
MPINVIKQRTHVSLVWILNTVPNSINSILYATIALRNALDVLLIVTAPLERFAVHKKNAHLVAGMIQTA